MAQQTLIPPPLIPGRPIVWPDTLPEEYALRCQGACMAPEFTDGALVHGSTSAAFGPGDLVLLWRDPAIVRAGEHLVLLKRLVLGLPPFVTFPWADHPDSEAVPVVGCEQLSPYRRLAIRCSHLIAIHRCLGPIAEERCNTLERQRAKTAGEAKGMRS